VGLPLCSNGILTHQINLSIGPAPVGAPTSPVHRSACVGAGLAWRPARSRDFQLILLRVRRSCCCSRVGAAAAAASSPVSYYKQKTKVYKGSSAMPQSTQKDRRGAARCASRGQRLRSAGKRQILTAPKFAFLLKEHPKINAVRGWKLV